MAFVAGFVDSHDLQRQERDVRGGLHIVRGDESALGAHRDVLQRYALRLCRNATDADDLVQDTLTRALARWSSLAPGTDTRAWLLSILHNVFIDSCRKQKQQGTRVGEDVVENVAAPEPEVEPRWAQITNAEVATAIDTLDPSFRDVYRLHARGEGYDAISRSLGIPKITVGTRLTRARKKMKALLFGEEES
ncbi:MAG: RNA polymerase sigma factor [Archangium gephyra]|uniref:RNA polymerase sigma factor n=1 Tax=Archangium gephyra TaxID=48 RepID=A0A2W5US74_9BACT|nr:MAG: RNA polymerase sigma factor [Archangium gephyra]